MGWIDALLDGCRTALTAPDPGAAVQRLVAEAVREPEAVLAALGAPDGVGMTTYLQSPELTVQRIVWGPGITSTAHEHGTWAVVGVYAGAELNVRFDVHDDALVERERREVGAGAALLLRPHEAHAVTGSPDGLTQALHVYGGDITALPRREWVGGAPRPFDARQTVTAVSAYRAWTASHGRLPTAEQGARLLQEAGYPLPTWEPVP